MKRFFTKAIAATATGAAVLGLGIPSAHAGDFSLDGCVAQSGFSNPVLQNGVIHGWGLGKGCGSYLYAIITLQERDPGSTTWRKADGAGATSDKVGFNQGVGVSSPCKANTSYRVRTTVFEAGGSAPGQVRQMGAVHTTSAWSFVTCK